jgi:hypothetical protein
MVAQASADTQISIEVYTLIVIIVVSEMNLVDSFKPETVILDRP